MENFIKLMKEDKEMVAEWNLCKLLFADKNEDEGISWKNPLRKLVKLDTLKNNLIKYQIKRNVAKFGTNFDYIFIDDRSDILNRIKIMLESSPDWLPKSVSISLYKYDYFELATEESNNAFQLFSKINFP